MPRARRPRQSLHEPPISREQRSLQDAESALVRDDSGDDIAMQDDADVPEADQVALQNQTVDAVSTVTHEPGQYPPVQYQAKKSDKKRNRREALMQSERIFAKPISPYSKSTLRRMKKKEKQSMGLEAVGEALADAMPSTNEIHDVERPLKSRRRDINRAPQGSSHVSASGTAKLPQATTSSKNLSSKARQRMLNHERQRLPAILAHSAFAASPFETIRLHARNTMAAEAAATSR